MIPTDFKGTATFLAAADIAWSAGVIGCDEAAIRAVWDVETDDGKGFDDQGRPIILFERHLFHRLTGGRFDASHPDISNPVPGGYGKFSDQYPKLTVAMALDHDAALKACSWGAFQVLGQNFFSAGYTSVSEMVEAMCISEGEHLKAFTRFVKLTHLDGALQRRAWTAFAHGYNGPAYAKNGYDSKLAEAYSKHAGQTIAV